MNGKRDSKWSMEISSWLVEFPTIEDIDKSKNLGAIVEQLLKLFDPIIAELRLPPDFPYERDIMKKWFLCQLIDLIRRFEKNTYKTMKLSEIINEIHEKSPIHLEPDILSKIRESVNGYIRRGQFTPYFIEKVKEGKGYNLNEDLFTFATNVFEIKLDQIYSDELTDEQVLSAYKDALIDNPYGADKNRLIIEVAQDLMDEYPDKAFAFYNIAMNRLDSLDVSRRIYQESKRLRCDYPILESLFSLVFLSPLIFHKVAQIDEALKNGTQLIEIDSKLELLVREADEKLKQYAEDYSKSVFKYDQSKRCKMRINDKLLDIGELEKFHKTEAIENAKSKRLNLERNILNQTDYLLLLNYIIVPNMHTYFHELIEGEHITSNNIFMIDHDTYNDFIKELRNRLDIEYDFLVDVEKQSSVDYSVVGHYESMSDRLSYWISSIAWTDKVYVPEYLEKTYPVNDKESALEVENQDIELKDENENKESVDISEDLHELRQTLDICSDIIELNK